MNRDNVILIGMPGVGKSTAGVVLAKILGYQFTDSDLIIQKEEDRLLKEIIEQEGIEGFIAVENRVNASLDIHKSVIATGGSVVYGAQAMDHLKAIGTVVYLKVGFEVIDSRLSDLKGRGVVLKEGQTLRDMYEERTTLYETYADITVDETGLGIEETVAEIVSQLDKVN